MEDPFTVDTPDEDTNKSDVESEQVSESSTETVDTSLDEFGVDEDTSDTETVESDEDASGVQSNSNRMDTLVNQLPDEFEVSNGYINHPYLENDVLESRAYQLQLFSQTRDEHSLVGLPTGLGKTTIAALAIADRLYRVYENGGIPSGDLGVSDVRCLMMAPKKPLVSQHVEFFKETISVPNNQVVSYTGDTKPANRGDLWDESTIVIATPQVIENDIIAQRIDLQSCVHLTVDECHRATGNYPYVFAAVAYHSQHGGNYDGREIPHGTDVDIPGVSDGSIDGDVDAVSDEIEEAGLDSKHSGGHSDSPSGMRSIDAPTPAETPSNACVLAMSASPGDNTGDIVRVCLNLGLENVTVMTDEDPLVEPYVYETDVKWKRVEMDDEITDGSDALYDMLTDRLEELKSMSYIDSASKSVSKTDLFTVRKKGQKAIENGDDKSNAGMAISLATECLTIKEAISKLEGQGPRAFLQFVRRRRDDASSSNAAKYVQRFANDERLDEVIEYSHQFINDGKRHPKYKKLRDSIARELAINDGQRVMVFCEYRDTALALEEFLSEYFTVDRIVGQNDREGDPGMSHAEQQDALNRFRSGSSEVLITTSVSEEGIDIPDVDLVVGFEPVLESVRAVQRQGRTGRQRHGKVLILMAEDTDEEGKYWASKNRQQSMKNDMKQLSNAEGGLIEILSPSDGGQQRLTEQDSGESPIDEESMSESSDEWTSVSDIVDDDNVDQTDGTEDESETMPQIPDDGEKPHIIIDDRELDSDVARSFSIEKDDIEHSVETLTVGDYICSDRIAVERKTVDDFYDTLTNNDRDLFQQAIDLKNSYETPVYIIEGESLFTGRNVHPNAVYGILTSLIADFGMTIFTTEDASETASVLASITKREQEDLDREVSAHGSKGKRTMDEQQKYFISSIQDIGPKTATALLEEFNRPIDVVTATKDELLSVDGVGEQTASKIKSVLNTEYKED